LLHVPLPPGQSQAWAEHFAQPPQGIQTGTHVAVVFRIGDEWLALPAQLCIEIAEMRPIRTVPHRRHETLLGIVNVRGALLPCVSLIALLNLVTDGASSDPAPSAATRPRLIIWSGAAGAVALRADEVEGVHRFFAEELSEGPATLTRAKATFTKGLIRRGEKTLALLDPQLLSSSIDRSLA
jgi:chemotaxis signal transduction protein